MGCRRNINLSKMKCLKTCIICTRCLADIYIIIQNCIFNDQFFTLDKFFAPVIVSIVRARNILDTEKNHSLLAIKLFAEIFNLQSSMMLSNLLCQRICKESNKFFFKMTSGISKQLNCLITRRSK